MFSLTYTRSWRRMINTKILEIMQRKGRRILKRKLVKKCALGKENQNKTNEKTIRGRASWRRTTKRLKRLGDVTEVKSNIFVPHTRNSKLATMLRDRETKIEETTGDGEDNRESWEKDRGHHSKQRPMEKQGLWLSKLLHMYDK